MGKKTDGRLDVKAVIDEFQRAEESPVHRKDAFKIDAPFEKALDKILSATNKAKVRPKMEAVNISKTAQGFEIGPFAPYLAKDLQEAEKWLRANFQVVPEEWAKLKRELESTGHASIERVFGKGEQVQ
jgi:hypothetical protein